MSKKITKYDLDSMTVNELNKLFGEVDSDRMKIEQSLGYGCEEAKPLKEFTTEVIDKLNEKRSAETDNPKLVKDIHEKYGI